MPIQRSYGYIKDTPDARDVLLCRGPRKPGGAALPQFTTNISNSCMPPIWNQLTLGSCTSFGSSRAYEWTVRKLGLVDFSPSRLQVYYDTRLIEGTTDEDSGAQVRDAMKALNRYGACPDTLWPYDVTQFTVEPPQPARDAAAKNLAINYARVPKDQESMLSILANGELFFFGFTCYPYFESDEMAENGILQLPNEGEQPVGGHCVCCVDFDMRLFDGQGGFIIANSWDTDWGIQGYFQMPFSYFFGVFDGDDLTSDYWMIDTVEELAD